MSKRWAIGIILIIFLLAVGSATAITYVAGLHPSDLAKTASVSDEKKGEVGGEEDKIHSATVLATGDLVMHPPLYMHNRDEAGNYTFDTFFAKVQDEIEGADIALANFECPSDPSRPAEGYPVFNAPQGFIPYLKSVGFDALATANNHTLDATITGVDATIADMEKHGMPFFGIRNKPDGGTLILKVDGIRIGLCGWSQFYNGLEAGVAEEDMYKISPLTEENVRKDIKKLKDDGADIIICWPHWGTEYAILPDDYQKETAEMLVRAGADVILGSHTHVLEPAQWIEVDGKKAWIIYSMGNAISNQREAYLGTMDTEIGVFVYLDIEKRGGVTKLRDVRLEPTYVNLYQDEYGRPQYEVLLLKNALENPAYDDTLKTRFQAAKDRAEEILTGGQQEDDAITEDDSGDKPAAKDAAKSTKDKNSATAEKANTNSSELAQAA